LFSSRRRHTRFSRDWSSDVCSSDLKLEEMIATFPKVSGQQPYLSSAANQVLTKARDYMKPFGDEFVAIEHLLLAILAGNDKATQIGRASCRERAELREQAERWIQT